MTARFESSLASALDRFLEFKRRRGYKYNRSEFTLRNFDRFVAAREKHGGSRQLDEIIVAWLANRPGRRGVSVSQEMAAIRQFWFYVRRIHPARCRREVRWPKLPTQTQFVPYVLTSADIRTLLRLASKLDRPRFRRSLYRALLLVLYCTGLRIGEAVRLRIADVDLRRSLIFVEEFKGRARWVPFHPSLRRELERYLRARRVYVGSDPAPNAPFFVASDGDFLSTRTAHYALSRMYRMAGLKPASGRVGPRPYDLRHTFAVHRLTRWYRQRVDLHARLPWLSAYLGHVNLLGTEVYLTATPELLALAGRRFRRRFAGARNR